jgi:hypothetical protein
MGYTAAMLVEEYRILQVSIFNTLQKNLSKVDFSKVVLDVITIADEVDSQLKQAMFSNSEPRPQSARSAASGLAGVETTSLGVWSWVMLSSILDTNFGACPFNICRMPGPNS